MQLTTISLCLLVVLFCTVLALDMKFAKWTLPMRTVYTIGHDDDGTPNVLNLLIIPKEGQVIKLNVSPKASECEEDLDSVWECLRKARTLEVCLYRGLLTGMIYTSKLVLTYADGVSEDIILKP